MTSRRTFLKMGAAGLLLPAAAGLRPGIARAEGPPPKRLILFHHPQGTVLSQHVPTGTPDSFSFPYITEPLAPWTDRLVMLTGIDNRMPRFNSVGNAHFNANYTFLTGMPFATQDESALSAAGPSIEQVVAERVGGGVPFPRLDFAVGGSETADGFLTQYEGAYHWAGPYAPISYMNDPATALIRVFGDQTLSPEEIASQRDRREAVLGSVLQRMQAMKAAYGGADLSRLESHEDRLTELADRIAAGTGTCTPPELVAPAGYRYGLDDDVSATLFTEIITSALACDLTRVATLTFANSHAPEFPWLWERNGGSPIVPLSSFDNWHAMVHADYQAGMEIAYRWYMEVLADLLQRLSETTDADGDNMLDTTLVVALSEYSSGRHWNNALPVVLAGGLGCATPGRWLDFMGGSVSDFEASGGYLDSSATTNQLWTSVLNLFGEDDGEFGLVDASVPNGPLPGLL